MVAFNSRMPRPKTLLWLSVAIAVATIVLKMGAWRITHSVGLLSDALEAFVNLAGALFAVAMVTIAERPADAEHPHGHHKAEYFASGFEGALIIAAALIIAWSAFERWLSPHPLHLLSWGLGLSVVSTALNACLAWLLLKAAQAHNSIALEADGKHLRTDVYTSIGVVVGLLLAMATGWHWLDPFVAIAVALNILREGWCLMYKSSQGLMDSSAEPAINQAIHGVLNQYAQNDAQGQVEVHFDHIVTRAAGQRNYVTMHLHLPSSWSLAQAADLRNRVEHSLMAAVPSLHATIELMPFDVEPHQVLLNAPLFGIKE